MCKAVLLESIRLSPIVVNLPREAVKDVEVCGKIIPKGTTVMINLWAPHLNARVYPEPEKFRAERFLEDRESALAYSFVPFSAGARNCIGQKLALQEAVVTLATIMQHFNVDVFDPNEKTIVRVTMALKLQNLNLKFTPRI